MKAIIVDDEALARDEMRFLIEAEEGVELVGEAGGGAEAVRLVAEKQPDLVFLDIQMPEMDGFQVIRALLAAGDLPLVVFTTAFDQYAIRAFEVNALDYLLKPVEKDRLSAAIEKARRSRPRPDEYIERVRRLTESIRDVTRFLPRIVIRRKDEVDLYETEKVAMLFASPEGVRARTVDGDFLTNYAAIDEIEAQLDPSLFLRLGKDMLVNLRRIAKIVPWTGGHYILTLLDGNRTEVTLNRSQATLLKSKVDGIA
ncbi:MAG: response regulator transcription factor [Candidatus Krumholzibacteriota bacterium]|nr:response regulator transcription factor [Candidatus Krumholzibacteriota bacterium]